MAIHLRWLRIECKEQKNYVYTGNQRRRSFSIQQATPGVSFARFRPFHLFILKSSEIYYRRINQERGATCFMSLEVSCGEEKEEEEEVEEEEEHGEDINVNNNSLIT